MSWSGKEEGSLSLFLLGMDGEVRQQQIRQYTYKKVHKDTKVLEHVNKLT